MIATLASPRCLKSYSGTPSRKGAGSIVLYSCTQSPNNQMAVPATSIDLTYSSRPSRRNKNKQNLYKPRTNTTELQKSFVRAPIPTRNSLSHSVAQSGTVDTFLMLNCCAVLWRRPIAVIAKGPSDQHPRSDPDSNSVKESARFIKDTMIWTINLATWDFTRYYDNTSFCQILEQASRFSKRIFRLARTMVIRHIDMNHDT